MSPMSPGILNVRLLPAPRVVALSLLSALLCVAPALAQDAKGYPTKPIRFIVPYPPAGGTDVVARVLSEPLAAALGQPIIIDNRGGAAGNLGTDLAAKAAPDGYTILFTLSSHTINPKLYDKLPFDVERDFVTLPAAIQYVKAGRLKALAIASDKRSAAAPDIPTIAETVPDCVVNSWYGALAPAKTPPAIVAKLQAAFVKVLALPEVKEKLFAQGAEAASSTSAELASR